MFKFLIDECLSPQLAGIAQAQGYQALHVNWLKLSGKKDIAISVQAIADDWIVVTNNAADYRAIYRSLDVHPGLVIILPSAYRNFQIAMFEAALVQIKLLPDLINKIVHVDIANCVSIDDFPIGGNAV